MNKLHVLFGTFLLLSAWSLGLAATASGEKKQWQGYLIDRQCAESVHHDNDATVFVLHHTKDCALMPNCRAKGYAIFVDNKFYELDNRGNELALKVLIASKKKRGFYVRVVATAQGSLLKVQTMKESQETKPNNALEMRIDGD